MTDSNRHRLRKLARLVCCFLLIAIMGCQDKAPPASPPGPESYPGPTPDQVTPQEGTEPKGPAPVAPAAPAAPVPPAAPIPQEPPPEATIKAMLEKDMWGPDEQSKTAGVKYTYNYKSLKIAPPRKGEFRTDGVPANKDTMVFAVKVNVEVVRTYKDGTSKQEEKNQTYVFFKDEFGDWTYRFIQNN